MGGEAHLDTAESGVPGRTRARIEDLLKIGEDLLVQVTKDAIARKGARITANITLPGRYLVYLPGVAHIGVSRRIEDPVERDRLKDLVRNIARELALEGGFIVRTAAEGRTGEECASDARYLSHLWEEIRRSADGPGVPALLHEEAGAVVKVLRDVFRDDVEEVAVDCEEVYREAVEFTADMQPALVSRIRMHEGLPPLFEQRGVQAQLERALRPRVWLRSGGHIVINQTEALVAIDVNTGKYVGKTTLEETILRTNLEAIHEVVRQIRLRDLGGIIVIDFIDMEEGASREEVIEALQLELKKDRSKSRVLQISEFGLVEITRQRTRPSLERLLCLTCPTCGGSGRAKSPDTVYFEVLREARKMLAAPGAGSVLVQLHPMMREALLPRHESLAAALGIRPGRLRIHAEHGLDYDQWSVVPS
jgi:Rne/Rng family ribonuclease